MKCYHTIGVLTALFVLLTLCLPVHRTGSR